MKAITALTHDVKEGQVHVYLDHVKKVGHELRDLLATVDTLMTAIPPSSHREVSGFVELGCSTELQQAEIIHF